MSAAALFGKLPAHGDFVARGFAAEERDALDDWLAASLAEAREGLGDRFETMFDMAPPWRFARHDTGGWTAGAVAPSVDGVGRRYPILAQRPVAEDGDISAMAAHCEAAIYDALDQGWDADALQQAITAEPAANDDDWPGIPGWWTLGGVDFDPATLTGAQPPLLVRAMLTMREGGREDEPDDGRDPALGDDLREGNQ